MKIAVSVLCMTLINPLPTIAALNVVADLGGNDTAPFFEGINRQDKDPNTNKVWKGKPGEAAMLPVVTPELSVGIETPRPLRLPGIGALFLIGDDPASRSWLQMNAAQIKKKNAVGLIVNVSSMSAVQSLRELASGIQMAPASGSELARRLHITHYPVLITDTGLASEVVP